MGAGTVTDNTDKNEKIEDVCTLSPEFCRKIYKCKKVLYNDIVFSAKNVESNEAQNNKLLQHYLNALNIYIIQQWMLSIITIIHLLK